MNGRDSHFLSLPFFCIMTYTFPMHLRTKAVLSPLFLRFRTEVERRLSCNIVGTSRIRNISS